MARARVVLGVATVCFVATVWLANWLVDTYGPVRVWPTNLYAPAGVYMISVALVLRDYIQYKGSRWLALAAIAAGTALSVAVSTQLATASAAAFAASECIGLALFWVLQRRSVVAAILVAGAAAAAVDSFVFLQLAFHSQAYFWGQFVAKVGLSLVAVPVVYGVRRASGRKQQPAPAPAG